MNERNERHQREFSDQQPLSMNSQQEVDISQNNSIPEAQDHEIEENSERIVKGRSRIYTSLNSPIVDNLKNSDTIAIV